MALKSSSIIGIGLCRPETSAYGMPGWHSTSWGYHGGDGRKFHNSDLKGLRYFDTYTKDDTIGCGVHMRTGNIFFTKNGIFLGAYPLSSMCFEMAGSCFPGVAFTNVKGMLYPMIGFGEREAQVLVNFGKSRFAYNISSHDWSRDRRSLDRSSASSKLTHRPVPELSA